MFARGYCGRNKELWKYCISIKVGKVCNVEGVVVWFVFVQHIIDCIAKLLCMGMNCEPFARRPNNGTNSRAGWWLAYRSFARLLLTAAVAVYLC